MANLNTVSLRANVARRIPDPNFKSTHNMERTILVVPVREIPRGLPLDPNARRPRTSKRVYQEVRNSLYGRDCEPGTFHLKNKGITIVAEAVKSLDDDRYEIRMLNGNHGILDGGHTYSIIVDAQDDPDLPDDQFVIVEVRTGVPLTWIRDMAGGLNTSVQVQDMSLDHLAGAFDWIKKALRNEPYFKSIAWSENDPGDFDARDIIALMALFNPELHPNDGDDQPIYAYEKKSLALKAFEEKPVVFENMEPILKDILRLHDIVRRDYHKIWNEAGGKAGHLAWSECKRTGEWNFIFTNQRAPCRMANGALYPILGAFRWFVELDPIKSKASWRGGFDHVLKAWRESALSLLKATHDMSDAMGRNPQSVGKSRPHWSNLHNMVAKRDLMRAQP